MVTEMSMNSTYDMPCELYDKIWEQLEKDNPLPYGVVDRWFALWYGLESLDDYASPDGTYPFAITNEKKFVIFLLRHA